MIKISTMGLHEEIKLFEGAGLRFVWDDEKEKNFFSVTDVARINYEQNEQ